MEQVTAIEVHKQFAGGVYKQTNTLEPISGTVEENVEHAIAVSGVVNGDKLFVKSTRQGIWDDESWFKVNLFGFERVQN